MSTSAFRSFSLMVSVSISSVWRAIIGYRSPMNLNRPGTRTGETVEIKAIFKGPESASFSERVIWVI